MKRFKHCTLLCNKVATIHLEQMHSFSSNNEQTLILSLFESFTLSVGKQSQRLNLFLHFGSPKSYVMLCKALLKLVLYMQTQPKNYFSTAGSVISFFFIGEQFIWTTRSEGIPPPSPLSVRPCTYNTNKILLLNTVLL